MGTTTRTPQACAARSGFTLIELLASMAIVGTLSAMAIPKVTDAVDRAKVAKAIEDIRTIQTDLAYLDAKDSLPASLSEIGWGGKQDPWGRPYIYFPFPPRKDTGKGRQAPAEARRDRFLVPINSTYDLYSMGKDGATVAALTAGASQDDVVRANDGGFVGLGRSY